MLEYLISLSESHFTFCGQTLGLSNLSTAESGCDPEVGLDIYPDPQVYIRIDIRLEYSVAWHS